MKIKRSFIAFVGMIGLLASLASCSDWGQMDPAAGTDVYPTREKLSTLNFNESTSLEELGYVQSYSAIQSGSAFRRRYYDFAKSFYRC